VRADFVFVHGFTQTAASWAPVMELMSADTRSLAVPVAGDFTAAAATLDVGPATYAGYSQGGRLCLQLALDRPGVVDRLVLVSASPGIAAEPARTARREADERLAREIERDGVDAFLERWLSQPLFATSRTLVRCSAIYFLISTAERILWRCIILPPIRCRLFLTTRSRRTFCSTLLSCNRANRNCPTQLQRMLTISSTSLSVFISKASSKPASPRRRQL